jgi:hypothetical protein
MGNLWGVYVGLRLNQFYGGGGALAAVRVIGVVRCSAVCRRIVIVIMQCSEQINK